MKKMFLTAAVVTTLASLAPLAAVSADPIPDLPGCNVYVSNAEVPVTLECIPYYYNGTLIYNGFVVNPGH